MRIAGGRLLVHGYGSGRCNRLTTTGYPEALHLSVRQMLSVRFRMVLARHLTVVLMMHRDRLFWRRWASVVLLIGYSVRIVVRSIAGVVVPVVATVVMMLVMSWWSSLMRTRRCQRPLLLLLAVVHRRSRLVHHGRRMRTRIQRCLTLWLLHVGAIIEVRRRWLHRFVHMLVLIIVLVHHAWVRIVLASAVP